MHMPSKEQLLTCRVDAQGQVIYLLGTLHTIHLEYEPYSLWHIKAIIQHLKPDVVLVESRPEELEKDNWADGPVEMPFASLVAVSLGIDARGMDWWRKEDLFLDLTVRDDHMVQNIINVMAEHRSGLVLAGYFHLVGFKKRLQQAGYLIKRMKQAEKQALFDLSGVEKIFPEKMKFYLRKRIQLEKESLQKETDADWRERLQSVIETRQHFLSIVEQIGEVPSGKTQSIT
jgi:hypothetical protein